MAKNPWEVFPDNGILRDQFGELTGRLDRHSDGSDWITTYPDGQFAGRYDPSTSQTWDVQGNFVGFGNLLASLLHRG